MTVSRRFGDLPFLLKVLSVAKALSIQAHPDLTLAQRLFKDQPTVYKDGNHKPEMALALTPFQALVGFTTPQQLRDTVAAVPELRAALGDSADAVLSGERETESLKAAFARLMSAPAAQAAAHVSQLAARLLCVEPGALRPHERLALTLQAQYPGDVGILAAFFLNLVELQPGQAVALAANEPHAYLLGECVEVMATSDNVVRAGLTPKLRDVATLTAMLTYTQGAAVILNGEGEGCVRSYAPGFDEFALDVVTALPGGDLPALPPSQGPAVLLCLSGGAVARADGKELVVQPGTALFLCPGTTLQLQPGLQGLQAVRARVSDQVFANA